MGRASTFTDAIAAVICDRLAGGESLRTICNSEDMPEARTVHRWIVDNEAFRQQYARAREDQAEFYADSIIQIADDGANDSYVDENGNKRTDQDVIARSRLRVDARKWYASKLAPKKYGDKIQQEVSGADGGALIVEIVRYGSKPAESGK